MKDTESSGVTEVLVDSIIVSEAVVEARIVSNEHVDTLVGHL